MSADGSTGNARQLPPSSLSVEDAIEAVNDALVYATGFPPDQRATFERLVTERLQQYAAHERRHPAGALDKISEQTDRLVGVMALLNGLPECDELGEYEQNVLRASVGILHATVEEVYCEISTVVGELREATAAPDAAAAEVLP